METLAGGRFTLKKIFQDNWKQFLAVYRVTVTWFVAYNVWKIMNCREPDGLGFNTYACPDHPGETCRIPGSCKNRFCSVCAKVQVNNWVADMNRMFPNCNHFHITFTVPSQFRELLFTKRQLLNADMITFLFKDYRNHERPVLYTLRTIEFIKKLVQHIPPHYFNVIRHYGLLASRVKASYKQIADRLLPSAGEVEPASDWRTRQTAFQGRVPLICTICKKVMVLVSVHLPNPLSRSSR
ncbi:MAG: transposase zinc-binding domain-containing protein [Magnetococcus sp. YQC-5]